MIDVIRKYAKDINKGDKIKSYPGGWLEVVRVSKSRHEFNGVEISFANGDSGTYSRHYIFEAIYSTI